MSKAWRDRVFPMSNEMTAASNQSLHFLVAVDGSEHSLAAVHWITQIGGDGARLRCTLLNVQKPVMSGEVGVLAPASIALDERDRSATDILEHAATVMRAKSIPFEMEEQMGDAATAIIARAEALGCDAIVIGRRGMSIVRAALLGSVSTEVIRESSIPIIIVRTLDGATRAVPLRLLIAVDGSASAMRAATFASRLAGLCHGEVDLVHVEPGLTVAGSVLGPREKLMEHWSGKHSEEELAGARGVLDRARVTYTEHVVASDETHSAILEVAREHSCGVIVMGTRGLGPVTALLLGSVAQSVLEQAPSTASAVALAR
jgi:nucleotide-binding universal stress UspA family protein